jgi:hypothetical protein
MPPEHDLDNHREEIEAFLTALDRAAPAILDSLADATAVAAAMAAAIDLIPPPRRTAG